MSATMDSSTFVDYFGPEVATFNIPGRTFAVKEFFLEDVLEMIPVSFGFSSFSYFGVYNPVSPSKEFEISDLRQQFEEESRGKSGKQKWGNKQWRAKRMKVADMGYIKKEVITQIRDELGRKYSERVVNTLYRLTEWRERGDDFPFTLAEALITQIHLHAGEGGILVFLPGWSG